MVSYAGKKIEEKDDEYLLNRRTKKLLVTMILPPPPPPSNTSLSSSSLSASPSPITRAVRTGSCLDVGRVSLTAVFV